MGRKGCGERGASSLRRAGEACCCLGRGFTLLEGLPAKLRQLGHAVTAEFGVLAVESVVSTDGEVMAVVEVASARVEGVVS